MAARDQQSEMLSATAADIAQCMRLDTEPQLQIERRVDYLGTFNVTGGYYVSDAQDNRFSVNSCIQLPRALREVLDKADPDAFRRSGLLPGINRAYFTIDNKLFLWNYNESSGEIYQYSDLSLPIIAVTQCAAKRDVFLSGVHSILAIATPVEVVLLAIKFVPANGVATPSVFDPILLTPTKYRIATDSLIVSSMCGTRTGRLFMCGRNGALYEFEYEHEDRLHSTPFADVLPCTRRRKARKTDHSNGFFSGVLGAFLSFIVPVTEDPIRQITIDETNPHVTLLWTLAKSGCVRCFDLGPKGDTTLAKWSLSGSQILSLTSRILSDAAALPTNMPSTEDWLVSICSVSRAEAAPAIYPSPCAVAITNRGHRIYFGPTNPSDVFANSFTVVSVRLAPPQTSVAVSEFDVVAAPQSVAPGWKSLTSPQNISRAISANGVVLMCGEGMGPNGSDKLISFSRLPSRHPDSTAPTVAVMQLNNQNNALRPAMTQATDNGTRSAPLFEFVDELSFVTSSQQATLHPLQQAELVVQDLAEMPSSFLAGTQAQMLFDRYHDDGVRGIIRSKVPLDGLSELATQHALPARRFLVLTNFGLTTLIKRRPIDGLFEALLVGRGDQFLQRFGCVDTFAMCLVLACTDGAAELHIKSSVDLTTAIVPTASSQELSRVREAARALLFRQDAAFVNINQANKLLILPAQTDFMQRFKALQMFISRLVRPLFLFPLLRQRAAIAKDAQNKTSFYLCADFQQLSAIDADLTRACDFLKHHGDDFVPQPVQQFEQLQHSIRERHKHATAHAKGHNHDDAVLQQWKESRAQVKALVDLLQRCAEGVRLFKLLLQADNALNINTERRLPLSGLLNKVLSSADGLIQAKMPSAISEPALPSNSALTPVSPSPAPATAAAQTFLAAFEFQHLIAPTASMQDLVRTFLKLMIDGATAVLGAQFPEELHANAPSLYGSTSLLALQANSELQSAATELVHAAPGSISHSRHVENSMRKYAQLLAQVDCQSDILADAVRLFVGAHAYAAALEVCTLRFKCLQDMNESARQALDLRPSWKAQVEQCISLYRGVLRCLFTGQDVVEPAQSIQGVDVPAINISKPALALSPEQRESTWQRLTTAQNHSFMRQWPYCEWFYESLIELGRERQLFAFNDQSVVDFLRQQSNQDHLLEFYTSNGRLKEAARLLFEWASKNNIDLDLRVQYLSDALRFVSHSSSSITRVLSLPDAHDSDLQIQIEQTLDFALLQRHVWQAMHRINPHAAINAELKSTVILDFQRLYEISVENSLWEQLLRVFHLMSERDEVGEHCKVFWQKIVERDLSEPDGAHRLAESMTSLRDLYSTDAELFPLVDILSEIQKCQVGPSTLAVDLLVSNLCVPIEIVIALFCSQRLPMAGDVECWIDCLSRYAASRPRVPSQNALSLLQRASTRAQGRLRDEVIRLQEQLR